MVRQALRYQVLDSSGVPIAGASIQVAQLGTTTNITQTMYAGLTGGTTVANPLITDASGWSQAYFNGTDAVALLRVTVIPTLTGFTFTTRNVQLGSDYAVLDAGDAPITGTTVDANDRFNMARSVAGNPATLVVGDMWYNTATNALHWEDNTGTQTVSSTTGDVTDVVAGDGLSGVESPAGVITIDVVAGNAINVDATDVEVDVNAATSAAGALDGTDKILISDTDDANATKSATISQIDPTMLDGTANQVYFSNSTGNVTGLTLGAAGTVLTSSSATTDPTFAVIPADATVGANKTIYSDNSDVVSGVAFGAAETVLTSSGTTSAPTWEVLSAGGGVWSTTSGDATPISIGDVVNLKTDGTVIKVQTSYSTGLQKSGDVTFAPANSYISFFMAQAYYANGTHWISTNVSSGGFKPAVIPCTITGGSTSAIGQGSAQPIPDTVDGSYAFATMWDSTADRLVCVWQDLATGYISGSIGTVTGTGSSATVSWSTKVMLNGEGTNFVELVDTAGANGGLTCIYRRSSTGGVRTINMIMNGTKTGWSTLGINSVTTSCLQPNSGSAGIYARRSFASAFNTTDNTTLSVMCYNNSYGVFYTFSLQMSGGVTGYWSPVASYNHSGWSGTTLIPSGIGMIYDPTSQTFLSSFVTGNGETTFRMVILMQSNTGGTITHRDELYYGVSRVVGALYNVNSGVGNSGYYYANGAGLARSQTGTILGMVSQGHSTEIVSLTAIGGATNTIELTGVATPTNYLAAGNQDYWSAMLSNNSPDKDFLKISTYWSGTMYNAAVSAQLASTTVNQWVGIAKTGTNASGEAIDVNVLGAIDETQTGLTVGSDYYVQNDGSVATGYPGSLDREIGRAIATNRLLIENTGSGAI